MKPHSVWRGPQRGLKRTLWVILLSCLIQSGGAAILPERKTCVLIEGDFDSEEPEFLLVFSAEPLLDSGKNLVSSLTVSDAEKLANNRDCAVIRVGGKAATEAGFEYQFGKDEDGNQPWNDGTIFKWETWEKLSPDVWDNLAIMSLPAGESGGKAEIRKVVVQHNDQLLYDSSVTQSYPNKQPVDAAFPPFAATRGGDQLPVLNLAEWMARFRDSYFELAGNPVLATAYADLGQTEKSKYANRGSNWCSEFATYVYRQNGIKTPDPNAADVHFESMRKFFEENGEVYPAREVAGWTDEQKLETILPGSFVSILTGDGSTHSIIFTGWLRDTASAFSQYAAISGNNKGMVWRHAPMSLPNSSDFEGKSKEELREFDDKVFFAVPKFRFKEPERRISSTGSRQDSDSWRTWKTADGRFSVEAKLVRFDSENVTLEKRDGATVTVKSEMLGSEDRDFLNKSQQAE